MSNFSAALEELRIRKGINKQSLAIRAGLTPSYVSHLTLGSRDNPSEETVSMLAKALELDDEEKKYLFERAGLPLQSARAGAFVSSPSPADYKLTGEVITEDWADAPNAQAFYGRVEELEELTQWISREHCQMVVVSGPGGIGKTMLAAKFARDNAGEFEYVFWRSLKGSFSLDSVLKQCITLLSEQRPDPHLSVDNEIRLLISYLKKHSCLLILDNLESILEEKEHAGEYREEYEEYSKLVDMIGSTLHKSCLLLTTREIPKEIALLESNTGPVRVYSLKGLKPEDGLKILEEKKSVRVDQTEQAKLLVQRYGGNPLALKVASQYIREVFNGNISAFLATASLVFKDIQDVLEQQFKRLSPLEQEIMYWLTVEREAITLGDLHSELVHSVKQSELIEALELLRVRDLIEQKEATYFLPPVILEYMTEKLTTRAFKEIESSSIDLIENLAMIKAQAKDYIRREQIRLILDPIAQKLLAVHGREGFEGKLKTILRNLHEAPLSKPGYAAGNILNLLIQEGYDLSGYDFSHLYVWQAYLQGVSLNRVNFSRANLERSVFTDTFTSILSVAVSPDGQFLAAGTENGDVRLWATGSGAPLRTYQGHIGRVRSVAFNPNGKTIVSGSEDYTLRVWSIHTDQYLHILEGHTDRVRAVAISPDGNAAISGSDDCSVRIWDLQTGSCLRIFEGHTAKVRAVAFSLDGSTIASGGEDQIVRVWDVRSGRCLKELKGHTRQIHDVTFGPDSKLLASGGEDQIVRVWDVRSGRCLKELKGHTNQVRSLAFNPGGNLIVSSSDDASIRLWDVQSGQCLKVLAEHLHRVYSVNFSLDGSTIISGSEDRTVRLWNVQSGQIVKTLQGYINQIRSVAFNPAGTILVSGGDDHQLRLWNVPSGQYIKTLHGHSNGIRCVAFSPDGEQIASASDDRTIRIWNAHTGKCLKILREHEDRVRTIAFNHKGNMLASGSEDQTVRLWNMTSGQRLKVLQGHADWVRSVAFSPDDTLLISAGEDYTIRLWDVQSGQLSKTLAGHKNGVRCVVFSPDGNTVASSGDDETIRIWDTVTWKNLRTLSGNTRIHWILSIAFGPDGVLLASGGEDQKVRLWDVKSGECLKTLSGHENRVYSVAFHPLEQILGSGSLDGTVRLWNIGTGGCINILKNNKPYEDMNVVGAQGLTETQEAILRDLGAIVEE